MFIKNCNTIFLCETKAIGAFNKKTTNTGGYRLRVVNLLPPLILYKLIISLWVFSSVAGTWPFHYQPPPPPPPPPPPDEPPPLLPELDPGAREDDEMVEERDEPRLDARPAEVNGWPL